MTETEKLARKMSMEADLDHTWGSSEDTCKACGEYEPSVDTGFCPMALERLLLNFEKVLDKL